MSSPESIESLNKSQNEPDRITQEKQQCSTQEIEKHETQLNTQKDSTISLLNQELTQKLTKLTQKRTAVSLSSTGSTESIDETQTEKNIKEKAVEPSLNPDINKSKKNSKNKRPRSLSGIPGIPTEQWLKPLEQVFEENSFKVTSYQFQNFFENMQSSNNPVTLAKNYTSNPMKLLFIM